MRFEGGFMGAVNGLRADGTVSILRICQISTLSYIFEYNYIVILAIRII